MRERHHPVGMGHINGPQHQRLEHAEDDDIGGDAERQCQDSSDGEARRAAHLAHGESQVLQKGGHKRPPVEGQICSGKGDSRTKAF